MKSLKSFIHQKKKESLKSVTITKKKKRSFEYKKTKKKKEKSLWNPFSQGLSKLAKPMDSLGHLSYRLTYFCDFLAPGREKFGNFLL